jgi:predicted RNA-binding protein YlqC (UPF0109 family)
MKELIEYIAKSLVDQPDVVKDQPSKPLHNTPLLLS